MKTTLLFALSVFFGTGLFAQEPTIAGDTMLCPEGEGTAYIVNDQAYDSYQWQYRFAFTSDPFTNISGANEATFTYDAYNYSLTDIRVVVTLGEDTYTSNELLIDGYVFLPIFTISDYDDDVVSINPENGNMVLCEGASFTLSAGMPYDTNVQWYKDGAAIDGATNVTLTVTGAGEYYVTAAPQTCPDYTQTSLPTVVEIDTECSLGVDQPGKLSFASWPNPVSGNLSFSASQTIETLDVYSITGQRLLSAKPATAAGSIDLGQLASGVYVMEVKSEGASNKVRIVKQ